MSPVIANYIPKKGEKVSKKKKVSRQTILQFLMSQNCTSAYDGLVYNQVSPEYAKIATEEIVVQLFRNYDWKVIGCGQQVTRRNWEKYNDTKNVSYRNEIDKKQRLAKHYVLFQSIHDDMRPYRVLLINGHKGNTAAKLYCGVISEDSDIYGVQFKELIAFESIRHTHEYADNLKDIVAGFAASITDSVNHIAPMLKEKKLTKTEFEMHLIAIADLPKKPIIKATDMTHHFYNTKQDVWGYTYRNLLTFCTDTLVNLFVRTRRVASITALHQQAQVALKIRQYVLEVLAQHT